MIYVERKAFSQQNSRKPNTDNVFGQVMCGKCVFELSPPWALAPISALAPITGGVFMLGPEQKNRACVRPPCEKTYLHTAVESSRLDEAVQQFSEPHPGRWTKRIGPPAEHPVRADGLLSHVLAQVLWLSACVILFCSLSSGCSPARA